MIVCCSTKSPFGVCATHRECECFSLKSYRDFSVAVNKNPKRVRDVLAKHFVLRQGGRKKRPWNGNLILHFFIIIADFERVQFSLLVIIYVS